ncbi:uncharacterized protein LOC110635866 isoform X2 [Hevea brasiliensis]|uniref:uncharacterized protein LOC110635866 isoform X2 n=1 Tax=Hevea brasiliensis TaxID=3981 RepID=UPI0025F6E41C|nr:uncharacterized protein LOC110635866 isoform X2 [Hevea brasiliensis]
MANMKQILIVLVTLLVVSTWVPVSFSAKKPVFAARKEDITFIKCQVCEKLAKELSQQAAKKQAQISPKKITEYQIIELAENVCNLKKEEADWIMKIDIVEQGDKLELVEQDTDGQCNSECKTIEQACEQVVGYSDTDIAEYIFSSKPDIDSLVNYLCKDLTNSCRKKPPPVPKDRTPGEPFVPKPAKDAEMEKILRSMEGMPGAPNMQMYSREDLMNMKNFGNEDGDENDDEDEAKVMRGKESRNDDWKQKITEGLKNTGETLKRHANKVSNRLRQWWKRIKAARTNKNSNAGKLEL